MTTFNIFIPNLSGGGAEKAAILLAKFLHEKYSDNSYRIFILSNEDVYSKIYEVQNIYLLPKHLLGKVHFVNKIISPSDFNIIYLSIVKFYFLLLLSNRAKNVYSFLQNPIMHALSLKKSSSFKTYLRLKLLLIAYKKSKRVLCISPGIQNDLKKLGIKNTFLLPNPIVMQNMKNHIKVRSHNKIYNIVSAGRLHEQKNYDLLLDVAKLTKSNVNFLIYGTGPDKDRLKTRCLEMKLQDKVKFKGFTSNLQEELRKADLFLLTSKYEGFGNVIIEALSNGTKVIATDVEAGPRYIINDPEIGHLVPQDAKEIANKLDKVLSSEWPYTNNYSCIRRAMDFEMNKVYNELVMEIENENY
jgi:glycosyltransferase involved in cell wall biosynthesis